MGNVQVLTLDTQPTMGTIFGTTVDNYIINSINRAMETTSNLYMQVSDIIEEGRRKFFKNVIEPIKKTIGLHKQLNLDSINKIIPILSEDDLFNVPPAMHLPILLYQPIRKLFEEGRIEGWDYKPEHLPEEDYYDRLIKNGRIEDVMSSIKEEGKNKHYLEFNYIFKSEDPDVDFDELDYIEQTRRFLDELLETSRTDPTNPTKVRG